MSYFSKALRTIGITPDEVVRIGAAYATGGTTAAVGTAIGSLGGPQEVKTTPPFVPAGSDYDRYMGQIGAT